MLGLMFIISDIYVSIASVQRREAYHSYGGITRIRYKGVISVLHGHPLTVLRHKNTWKFCEFQKHSGKK
jgi:hypothetical protein